MRKSLSRVALALAAILALSTAAQAQTYQTHQILKKWESGSVAAGAIITSPTMNLAGLSNVDVYVDNSLNSSTTGTLTAKWYASDCATLVYTQTVTAANSGTNGGYTVASIDSSQIVLTTSGVTQIPIDPGYCMSFSLAAAGAVARQVNVYARP